uniref:Movement protein TGB2 n=1 Tax=Potato virus S TaxID=12169 RepID=A0A2P1E977_9VIRU|nr:TGB2 [Potato virus S]
MPLTPPPDHTKLYIAIAIGLSTALIATSLTRSTLPIVGDSQHNLPHGGRYRDGTKAIDYYKPCKLNSIEVGSNWIAQPWLVVIALIGLIFWSQRYTACCNRCNQRHST